MTREQVMAEALAEVWSGADEVDAGAVLDQLLDRGWRLVPMRQQVLEVAGDRTLGGANPTGRLTG